MLASPLLLLVSAPFHWPYRPATSLHAGLVPPLADPLRAAARPCLRARFSLLGRCLIVRTPNKRHAEHDKKDSSESKMYHYLPSLKASSAPSDRPNDQADQRVDLAPEHPDFAYHVS